MSTTLLAALFHDRLSTGRRAWRAPLVVHGAAARLWPWIDEPMRTAPALLAAASESDEPIKVAIEGPDGSHRASLDRGPLARQHYEAGATVTLMGLERTVAGARRLIEALGAELGLAPALLHCNAHLSPAGHGVPLRFDGQEVIVVQLAGVEAWRLAPDQRVSFPPEGDGGRRIVMRPGSVLFMPRGVWHETRAEAGSLSLTISLKFPTWVEVVTNAVRLGLLADARWRRPVVQEPRPGGWKRRRARLVGALRSLVDAAYALGIARDLA